MAVINYLLNAPLLTAFAEFVAHQIGIHTRAQEMVEENAKLKVNQPSMSHALLILNHITEYSWCAYVY